MDSEESIMTIEDDKENVVGCLYLEDGKLHFKGNTDESAEIFFKVLLEEYNAKV